MKTTVLKLENLRSGAIPSSVRPPQKHISLHKNTFGRPHGRDVRTTALNLRFQKDEPISCPSLLRVYTFFTYLPQKHISLHKNTFPPTQARNAERMSARANISSDIFRRPSPKFVIDRFVIDPDRSQVPDHQYQSTSDRFLKFSEAITSLKSILNTPPFATSFNWPRFSAGAPAPQSHSHPAGRPCLPASEEGQQKV